MTLLEKTMVLSVVDISREELLIIKNVLYEACVEIGEWDFTKRIGMSPEEAIVLLKEINAILKTTI